MSLASGLGWLAIVAALLLWEGIGLTRNRDGWYTMSDLVRVVTANPVGRWLLFAGWLWLGWHLFIRGWRFFLRARTAAGPVAGSPSPAQGASQLLRTDVAPLAVTFVLLAVAVRAWYRPRLHPPTAPPPPRRGGLLDDVAVTLLAGYVLFLAVDGLYYALVAGQRHSFLIQAATGGAFLAFVAAPIGFAAIGALAWALRWLAGRKAIRT